MPSYRKSSLWPRILPAALALAFALTFPAYSVRDGNGGYALPVNAFSDPVTGGTLTASDADAVWRDLEAEIANSVAADGQTTMSGDLKMGGNQLVNVGVGSARTEGVNLGQVQDSGMKWGGVAGGTGNALTLAPSPVITAYADGQTFWFVSSGANTGATTVNISSVGVEPVLTRNGDALVAGDIESGAVYAVTYYNSNFYLWSPAPQLSLYAALATANTFTAAQTTTLTTAGTIQTFTSTDAGAGTGPEVVLYRDSASPAVSDVMGRLTFNGEDSAGNAQLYGALDTTILDTTSGSEDSQFRIIVPIAGVNTAQVGVGDGVIVAVPTGSYKGTGTINAAAGLYVNGHGTVAQQPACDTEAAYTTLGTILPFDNSIPQNTEGDEVLSLAITPTNASSVLEIEANLLVGVGVANGIISGAIFVDTTADAIYAGSLSVGTSGRMETLRLVHYVTAGSTSARTYKVRAGSSVATDAKLNGDDATRIFGGVAISSLCVTEILPQ